MELQGISLTNKSLYSQFINPEMISPLSKVRQSSQNKVLDNKEAFSSDLITFLESFFQEKGLNLENEKIQQVLSSLNKYLKIEIDEVLKIPIYKIIDLFSEEVLKQIPLEDIVDFKRALYEFLKNQIKEKPILKALIIEKEV